MSALNSVTVGAALLCTFLVILRTTLAAPYHHDQISGLEPYYTDSSAGCYYNFQHYDEGDRIITNEPCLNCTCHNRMLMCYLRVCPFSKAIGQDCTVEKKPDQCCPVITCPEVPVHLLSATTTEAPEESTDVGHPDNYGCSIDDAFYADGAQVPSNPHKPCELCYCIRNRTACVIQECTLNVEGCKPVYQDGVCCPVRYDCDYEEEKLETTVRPTPGLIFSTTLQPGGNLECYHNNEIYADGALLNTEKPCEHCYCMKGEIVCAVQECGTPLENVGKNCTAVPPKEGQCCPDTYECATEAPTDFTTTESYVETTSLKVEDVQFNEVTDAPVEHITKARPVEPEIVQSELTTEHEDQEAEKSVEGQHPEYQETTKVVDFSSESTTTLSHTEIDKKITEAEITETTSSVTTDEEKVHETPITEAALSHTEKPTSELEGEISQKTSIPVSDEYTTTALPHSLPEEEIKTEKEEIIPQQTVEPTQSIVKEHAEATTASETESELPEITSVTEQELATSDLTKDTKDEDKTVFPEDLTKIFTTTISSSQSIHEGEEPTTTQGQDQVTLQEKQEVDESQAPTTEHIHKADIETTTIPTESLSHQVTDRIGLLETDATSLPSEQPKTAYTTEKVDLDKTTQQITEETESAHFVTTASISEEHKDTTEEATKEVDEQKPAATEKTTVEHDHTETAGETTESVELTKEVGHVTTQKLQLDITTGFTEAPVEESKEVATESHVGITTEKPTEVTENITSDVKKPDDRSSEAMGGEQTESGERGPSEITTVKYEEPEHVYTHVPEKAFDETESVTESEPVVTEHVAYTTQVSLHEETEAVTNAIVETTANIETISEREKEAKAEVTEETFVAVTTTSSAGELLLTEQAETTDENTPPLSQESVQEKAEDIYKTTTQPTSTVTKAVAIEHKPTETDISPEAHETEATKTSTKEITEKHEHVDELSSSVDQATTPTIIQKAETTETHTEDSREASSEISIPEDMIHMVTEQQPGEIEAADHIIETTTKTQLVTDKSITELPSVQTTEEYVQTVVTEKEEVTKLALSEDAITEMPTSDLSHIPDRTSEHTTPTAEDIIHGVTDEHKPIIGDEEGSSKVPETTETQTEEFVKMSYLTTTSEEASQTVTEKIEDSKTEPASHIIETTTLKLEQITVSEIVPEKVSNSGLEGTEQKQVTEHDDQQIIVSVTEDTSSVTEDKLHETTKETTEQLIQEVTQEPHAQQTELPLKETVTEQDILEHTEFEENRTSKPTEGGALVTEMITERVETATVKEVTSESVEQSSTKPEAQTDASAEAQSTTSSQAVTEKTEKTASDIGVTETHTSVKYQTEEIFSKIPEDQRTTEYTTIPEHVHTSDEQVTKAAALDTETSTLKEQEKEQPEHGHPSDERVTEDVKLVTETSTLIEQEKEEPIATENDESQSKITTSLPQEKEPTVSTETEKYETTEVQETEPQITEHIPLKTELTKTTKKPASTDLGLMHVAVTKTSLYTTEQPQEISTVDIEKETESAKEEETNVTEHKDETSELPQTTVYEPIEIDLTDHKQTTVLTTQHPEKEERLATTQSATSAPETETEKHITDLPVIEETSDKVIESQITEKNQPNVDETQKPVEVTTVKQAKIEEQEKEITSLPIVPGEGSCLVEGQTYENNSNVPPINPCKVSCKCLSSVVQCESMNCAPPPSSMQNCMPIYHTPNSCCPTYACNETKPSVIESDSQVSGMTGHDHKTTVMHTEEEAASHTTEQTAHTEAATTILTDTQTKLEESTVFEHLETSEVTTQLIDKQTVGEVTTSHYIEREYEISTTARSVEYTEKDEMSTALPESVDIVQEDIKTTVKEEEHAQTTIASVSSSEETQKEKEHQTPTEIPTTTPAEEISEKHVEEEEILSTTIATVEEHDIQTDISEIDKSTEAEKSHEDEIKETTVHPETEIGTVSSTPSLVEDAMATTVLSEHGVEQHTELPDEFVTVPVISKHPEEESKTVGFSHEEHPSDMTLPTITKDEEYTERTTLTEKVPSEEKGTTEYNEDKTQVEEQYTTEGTAAGTTELEMENYTEDKLTKEHEPIVPSIPSVSVDEETGTKSTIENEILPEIHSSEAPEKLLTEQPEEISQDATPHDRVDITTHYPTISENEETKESEKEAVPQEEVQMTETATHHKDFNEIITTAQYDEKTGSVDLSTKIPGESITSTKNINTLVEEQTTAVPVETEVATTTMPEYQQEITHTTILYDDFKKTEKVDEEISVLTTLKSTDITYEKTTEFPITTEKQTTIAKEKVEKESTTVPTTDEIHKTTEPHMYTDQHFEEETTKEVDTVTSPSAEVESQTSKAIEQNTIIPEELSVSSLFPESHMMETTVKPYHIHEATSTSSQPEEHVSEETEKPEDVHTSTTESVTKSSVSVDENINEIIPTFAPHETSEDTVTSKTVEQETVPSHEITEQMHTTTQPEIVELDENELTTVSGLKFETTTLKADQKATHTEKIDEYEVEHTTKLEEHILSEDKTVEQVPQEHTEMQEEHIMKETTPLMESTSEAIVELDEHTKLYDGQEEEKTHVSPSETVTTEGHILNELDNEVTERIHEDITTTSEIQTTQQAVVDESKSTDTSATKAPEPDIHVTTEGTVVSEETSEKIAATTFSDQHEEHSTTDEISDHSDTAVIYSTIKSDISEENTTPGDNEDLSTDIEGLGEVSSSVPTTEYADQLFTSGIADSTTKSSIAAGELSTSAPVTSEKETVPEATVKPVETHTSAHTYTTTLASHHHISEEHVPDMPDYNLPTDDYEDEQNSFGPGTCRYGGKIYVSAQQIPRDDPCDFCFCFRSDIICLQQSCPPPIPGCHEEPIPGFCCPRYECRVSMATSLNLTTTTTTTTTTLPPHFLSHAYNGAAYRQGCQIQGQAYRVGEVVRSASGPCLHCTCGGDGQMKCDPKNCSPQPMLQQMIAAAASRR